MRVTVESGEVAAPAAAPENSPKGNHTIARGWTRLREVDNVKDSNFYFGMER